MPVYFASDVHLRSDRPERALRFARWVGRLQAEDTVWIVGDLCDFWCATRQGRAQTEQCPGLIALASFRARGGSLNILPGNHDVWLGPFYERFLQACFVAEPVDIQVCGFTVRLVHGHLLGARRRWKAGMESRAFYHAFARLPRLVANPLDRLLEQANENGRLASEERHLRVFRRYASGLPTGEDMVIFGHVHRQVDELAGGCRLIVLGGWHDSTNYLKIDQTGALLRSEADTDDRTA